LKKFYTMKKLKIILALALAGFAAGGSTSAQDADTNSPVWLTQPLSLMQALNIALQQNPTILKAKNDLEVAIWRGGADARGRVAAGGGDRPIQGHRPECD
jgi:outer membrane protein TolC